MASLVLAMAMSLIVFLAFYLRGITGFGASLMAMPFIVLLSGDVRMSVVLFAVVEFFSAIMIVRRQWGLVRFGENLRPLIFVSSSTLAGCLLLWYAPNSILRLAFSLFILAFALKLFQGPGFFLRSVRLPSAVHLVLGGLFSGLYNTGRPFITYHLSGVVEESRVSSSMTTVFIVKTFLQLLAYTLLGLLGPEVLFYSLFALPALALASLFASATPTELDEQLVTGAASLVLFAAGLLLLLT